MAIDTFTCPDCGVKLRRSPHLTPGSEVKCPRCSREFAVPPVEADSPDGGRFAVDRVGNSLASERRSEVTDRPSLKSDLPRRDMDEDYDADYPHARGRTPGELTNDYKIDLGRWFTEGFEHYGAMLGPFIGWAFIFLFLCIPLFILFPLAPFVVPHLAVGPIIVALKLLKRRPWSFGDFFGGFSWYGQLLGWTLLSGGAQLLLSIPYMAAYIYLIAQASSNKQPGPEAILMLLAGALFTFLTTTYLQVRWFYSLYLILDRNYGAKEALRGSWRMTEGRFWITFAIWFLTQTINSAGAAACYVGMVFTFPIGILVSTAGYLLITNQMAPEVEGRPELPRRDNS